MVDGLKMDSIEHRVSLQASDVVEFGRATGRRHFPSRASPPLDLRSIRRICIQFVISGESSSRLTQPSAELARVLDMISRNSAVLWYHQSELQVTRSESSMSRARESFASRRTGASPFALHYSGPCRLQLTRPRRTSPVSPAVPSPVPTLPRAVNGHQTDPLRSSRLFFPHLGYDTCCACVHPTGRLSMIHALDATLRPVESMRLTTSRDLTLSPPFEILLTPARLVPTPLRICCCCTGAHHHDQSRPRPLTSTRPPPASSKRSSRSSSPRRSRVPTFSSSARRVTSSSRRASSLSTTRPRVLPRVSSSPLFPLLVVPSEATADNGNATGGKHEGLAR